MRSAEQAAGDPVNFTDPSGLGVAPALNDSRQQSYNGATTPDPPCADCIVLTGSSGHRDNSTPLPDLGPAQNLREAQQAQRGQPNATEKADAEIVVTGRRIPKDKAKPQKAKPPRIKPRRDGDYACTIGFDCKYASAAELCSAANNRLAYLGPFGIGVAAARAYGSLEQLGGLVGRANQATVIGAAEYAADRLDQYLYCAG